MLKDLAKFLLTVFAIFVVITSVHSKRSTKLYQKPNSSQPMRDIFWHEDDDQDKSWAPHFCCGSCRSTLEGWMRGSHKCMPFAIPRIWREPTNHHDDCYFCMVVISKYEKTKYRKKIVYLSIPSSIAPVNHGPELSIPQPPTTHAVSSTSSEDDDADFEVDTQCSSKDPHFPNQNELDNPSQCFLTFLALAPLKIL